MMWVKQQINAQLQKINGAVALKNKGQWVVEEAMHIFTTPEQEGFDSKYSLPEEFDIADIMQACDRASKLGDVLDSIPKAFWILCITLVWQFVFLANEVMDLWVETIMEYCGTKLTYIALTMAISCGWPGFILYFVRAFQQGEKIIDRYMRTAQLRNLPDSLSDEQQIVEFCKERKLECESIRIPELMPAKLEHRVVELVFEDRETMKNAFRSGGLQKEIHFSKDQEVPIRVKVKTLSASATIEHWLTVFRYLEEGIPSSTYYIRGILSVIVTLSLSKIATTHMLENIEDLKETLLPHKWRTRALRIFCFGSLAFLVFFVGYHGFKDIREAREEIESSRLRRAVTQCSSKTPQLRSLKLGERNKLKSETRKTK